MTSLEFIFSGQGKFSVVLLDGGRMVETIDFLFGPVKGDFETLLIGAIDKILKRNSIPKLSLYSVSIGGFVEKSSLSYGVAVVCAAALCWPYRQSRRTRA